MNWEEQLKLDIEKERLIGTKCKNEKPHRVIGIFCDHFGHDVHELNCNNCKNYTPEKFG